MRLVTGISLRCSLLMTAVCLVIAGDNINNKTDLSDEAFVEFERNDVAASDKVDAVGKAADAAGRMADALKAGNAQLALFVPVLTAEGNHIQDLLQEPHPPEETQILIQKREDVMGTVGSVNDAIAADNALLDKIAGIEFEAEMNRLITFQNEMRKGLQRKPLDLITLGPTSSPVGPPKPPTPPTATGTGDLLKENEKLFGELVKALQAKQAAINTTKVTTLSDLEKAEATYLAALLAEEEKLKDSTDLNLQEKHRLLGLLIPSVEKGKSQSTDAKNAQKDDEVRIGLLIIGLGQDIQRFEDQRKGLKK